MSKTRSIDGFSPVRSPRQSHEGVLYDRRQPVSATPSETLIDGLRAAPASVSNKLRMTKAKQRGWEVVNQARQDSKHRSRVQQRKAAQQAARDHRQRHDIDNYAQRLNQSLDMPDPDGVNQPFVNWQRKDDKPSRLSQVMAALKMDGVAEIFSTRPMKLATVSVGMSAVLIGVVGLALATMPQSGQVGVESGQVYSAVDQRQFAQGVASLVAEAPQSVSIPALANSTVALEPVGLDSSGQPELPSSSDKLGWQLTGQGNQSVVLSGSRSGLLADASRLRPGDQLVLTASDNSQTSYRVVRQQRNLPAASLQQSLSNLAANQLLLAISGNQTAGQPATGSWTTVVLAAN